MGPAVHGWRLPDTAHPQPAVNALMNPSGANELRPGTRRLGPAIILIVFLALGYVAAGQLAAETPSTPAASEIRMPVANPLLEPDRPDLLGEPRIDDGQ